MIFNISNFYDLVPACAHKDNMEINLKLYIRNIFIEFMPSNGKVYLKRNELFPLEYDLDQVEFILKNMIQKIAKIKSIDSDYFFRSKIKKKMENNLCDSNILNLSQSKTIFKGLDSLYEIYYFHKHFKNLPIYA